MCVLTKLLTYGKCSIYRLLPAPGLCNNIQSPDQCPYYILLSAQHFWRMTFHSLSPLEPSKLYRICWPAIMQLGVLTFNVQSS